MNRRRGLLAQAREARILIKWPHDHLTINFKKKEGARNTTSVFHDVYHGTNVKNLSDLKFIKFGLRTCVKAARSVFHIYQMCRLDSRARSLKPVFVTWRLHASDADFSDSRKRRWPCIVVSFERLSYFRRLSLSYRWWYLSRIGTYIANATTSAGGSE